MGDSKKRKRSSSLDLGSHAPPLVSKVAIRRKNSVGSVPEMGSQPIVAPPKRQRHAFLPGLAAFDPNHSFAAAMELRAHKTGNDAKYAPGSLFVENDEAKQSVINLLTQRKQASNDAKEITNIEHALGHIHVLGDQLQGPLGSGTGKDKLYVKGHGNPKNKDSIATTTLNRKKQGAFFLETGFRQQHTAKEIAQGISQVHAALGDDKLDIRMTSCGSAGGYTKNTSQQGAVSFSPIDKNQTFAGSLQSELDKLRADTFTVHGYRGDANTSFPVKRQTQQGTFSHFRTTVKDDGSGHQKQEIAKLFDQSAEPQVTQRPVKGRLNQQQILSKNLTAPQAPVLPDLVQQKSTQTNVAYGFRKNLKEDRLETRRSSTRVSMKD